MIKRKLSKVFTVVYCFSKQSDDHNNDLFFQMDLKLLLMSTLLNILICYIHAQKGKSSVRPNFVYLKNVIHL